ncbi:hypothetical protein CCR75_005133 [Bremia lactucae]|uniref:Uncharacterized protein n=1 Tax=Bremia lactucae TaxID=4779 RepID=A0A976FES9_BRELC|nr:hypothetical protein CCR75_005133 [Bremia lactucae]
MSGTNAASSSHLPSSAQQTEAPTQSSPRSPVATGSIKFFHLFGRDGKMATYNWRQESNQATRTFDCYITQSKKVIALVDSASQNTALIRNLQRPRLNNLLAPTRTI